VHDNPVAEREIRRGEGTDRLVSSDPGRPPRWAPRRQQCLLDEVDREVRRC
jgi:hypothetical protein